MDGMPFGNNMRPMFGSMYEFSLMSPQPTPFYNPQLFNFSNNNNNNFSNYVPNRVPSMRNILHIDNNNNNMKSSDNNNNSNVMMYHVDTRHTRRGNA